MFSHIATSIPKAAFGGFSRSLVIFRVKNGHGWTKSMVSSGIFSGLAGLFIATYSGSEIAQASSDDHVPFEKFKEASTGKKPMVLVACGSFSPVTHMHLRLFEDARNFLMFEKKKFDIVAGILSPVHDGYGKQSLIPAHYRLDMAYAATEESPWLQVSEWECKQTSWTPTASVLKKYSQQINASGKYQEKVTVALLCGADLLETFLVPNLWSVEDMEFILNEGIVCLGREGMDANQLITENEFLRQYKDNIHLVPPQVKNNISSTVVRKFLKQGLSVKYLIPDAVSEYIYMNGLYNSKRPAWGKYE